jgi:hypothetical protein
MKNFTISIKTRIDSESAPVEMRLTVDNTLLSMDDMEEYARRAITVQLQNEWRSWMKSDKSKVDPLLNDTYKTRKPGVRSGTEASAEAKLHKIAKILKDIKLSKKMTTEEFADYLDSL